MTDEGFFVYELHKLGYTFEEQKKLTFQQVNFLRESINREREEKRNDTIEFLKALRIVIWGSSASSESTVVDKKENAKSLINRHKQRKEGM